MSLGGTIQTEGEKSSEWGGGCLISKPKIINIER
jgi:hypothetical protein